MLWGPAAAPPRGLAKRAGCSFLGLEPANHRLLTNGQTGFEVLRTQEGSRQALDAWGACGPGHTSCRGVGVEQSSCTGTFREGPVVLERGHREGPVVLETGKAPSLTLGKTGGRVFASNSLELEVGAVPDAGCTTRLARGREQWPQARSSLSGAEVLLFTSWSLRISSGFPTFSLEKNLFFLIPTATWTPAIPHHCPPPSLR